MQDTRVSIIIPIYNAEEHLEECLKSLTIASNGDANAEILCISDGSKDSSVDIVKKFADKDKRFKLIEKENEGVSMTRNRGIKEASGDYIMFLDSDDYFRPDAIKTAISQMENTQADIGIFKYDDNGKINGINGSVSLDQSFINYTKITLENNYNGF